jgi:hypothetical protein
MMVPPSAPYLPTPDEQSTLKGWSLGDACRPSRAIPSICAFTSMSSGANRGLRG